MMHDTPHPHRGEIMHLQLDNGVVDFEVEDWADRVQSWSTGRGDMVYGRILNHVVPLSRLVRDDALDH
jgi:hypothetical protein